MKLLYEVIAKEDFMIPQYFQPVHVKKGEVMEVYEGKKKAIFAEVRGLKCYMTDEFFEEFYDKTE